MVPPEGRGVVGVKERVTGTEALPLMRSDEAMTNDTFKTVVGLSQASNCCTSASESFTLYTRTDWIAKSDVSSDKKKPVLIASLSNAWHSLAAFVVLSTPLDLKLSLQSDPKTQSQPCRPI